jgi:hypothetical protein
MNPIATNIRNGNPETDSIEDLLEIGTDTRGQTIHLIYRHTAKRCGLSVEYAGAGINTGLLANIKWRADRGETCPIQNPTIENVLAYAAAHQAA